MWWYSNCYNCKPVQWDSFHCIHILGFKILTHFWKRAALESLNTGKINYISFLKQVILYIKNYFKEVSRKVLVMSSFFIALFIFINYHYHLDDLIRKNSFGIKLILWHMVFAAAFYSSPIISASQTKSGYIRNKRFILLELIAPLIFALKLTIEIPFTFSLQTLPGIITGTILCTGLHLLL